jgi:hypothetical protein
MSVILIQCGDHLENQQRILPLAKWLKSQGYQPIIMVYKISVGSLFLSEGIEVEPLNVGSEHLKSSSLSNVKSEWSKVDFNEAMLPEFEKTPYLRMPKYSNKNVDKFNRHLVAIHKLVIKLNPSFIFIWNGYTGIVANILRLYCISYSVKCAYLERGYKKNTLYVDPQGVNGFSLLSDTPAYDNEITKIVDLDDIRSILVPLQVQTDTNIIFNSPIKTMRSFVLWVRKYFPKATNIIVKTHPEENEKSLNLPKYENITYINGACDLNLLILNADLIVTINSTVGMTALFNEKPVVALGKAIFTEKNMIITKRQVESYVSKFELNGAKFFKDDLDNNYTITSSTPAGCLLNLFPAKANKSNSIKASAYRRQYLELAKDFKKYCKLNNSLSMEVLFGYEYGLDLTYRNTNVEFSLLWAKHEVRRKYKIKIPITLHTSNLGLAGELKCAIVHSRSPVKFETLRHYDFVFNEYMDLLPSNGERK